MRIETRAKAAGATLLAAAIVCLASSIVSLMYMGTEYGVAPGGGDVVLYLYHINAFFCVFAAVFAVASLRGATLSAPAKTAGWAMLFLSVASVTPFLTDALPYLTEMTAVSAFQYVCAYIPFFALIVCLTAWIGSGCCGDTRKFRVLTLISALAAVFCCIDYLWQLAPLLGEAQSAYDTSRLLGMLAGFLCVTLACIQIWCLSASRPASDDHAPSDGDGPEPENSLEAGERSGIPAARELGKPDAGTPEDGKPAGRGPETDEPAP